MPIRTVIIDDEPLALEELSFQLAAFPDVTVVGQGTNGVEAVQLIRQLRPDLVMLDVQMPGMDGVQVVRAIADEEHVPRIVFVTAYDQYALKAFEVNAVDYLLKPIDEELLNRAVQRVKKQVESALDVRDHFATLIRSLSALSPSVHHSHRVTLKKGTRIILVDVNDIMYAYIAEGVVFVVTDTLEGMTSYRTLEELELTLDPQVFWRVHRSYLANINRVAEVIPWFSGTYRLVMNDKQKREIPLSRAQAKKLRKALKW